MLIIMAALAKGVPGACGADAAHDDDRLDLLILLPLGRLDTHALQ